MVALAAAVVTVSRLRLIVSTFLINVPAALSLSVVSVKESLSVVEPSLIESPESYVFFVALAENTPSKESFPEVPVKVSVVLVVSSQIYSKKISNIINRLRCYSHFNLINTHKYPILVS